MPYTVDGDLEYMAKVAILATTVGYARLTAIIPAASIRKFEDVSSARVIDGGAIAINTRFDKSLAGTCVEYHGVIEWICSIYKAQDTTGEKIGAMVGAVRDLLNTDDADGSGNNFLTTLNANATSGPMVFHDVREGILIDESQDKTVIHVLQADCWAYPGSVS